MGGSSSTAGQKTDVPRSTLVSLQSEVDIRPKSPSQRPKSPGLRPKSPGKRSSSKSSSGSKDSEGRAPRYETSKVGIFLRCESLHRACKSFVVVYAKTTEDSGWTEYGRTGVHNEAKWPNYDEGINVPFYMERVQLLRLEVYRCRDELPDAALQDQAFLGSAEAYLLEALHARNEGHGKVDDGWLKLPLKSLKPNSTASICLWAEEESSAKTRVSWNMKGSRLRSTDFFKSVDPYVCLYRVDSDAIHRLMPELQFMGRSDDSAAARASVATNADAHRPMPSLEDFACLEPKERHLVLQSSTVRRRSSPKWPDRCEVSIQNLCNSDSDHAILADVWDWYKQGEDQLIGSGITTYPEIHKAFRKSTIASIKLELPIMSRKSVAKKKANNQVRKEKGDIEAVESSTKKAAGHLELFNVLIMRQFTFIDYVRGGLELKLIVAVDCTRSNGKPLDPCSPHYLDSSGMNNYAATIRAVGDVLKFYSQGDDWYTVYGFGAKIPPTKTICSDCFALTGDWFAPEVNGVDALVEAYQNGMRAVRFHGPTRLRRVIEVAADWAAPYVDVHTPNDNGVDMKYFVLMILSDGGIDDQKQVIDTILQTMHLPLSILIVDLGIGSNELKELGKEVEILAEFHQQPVREMINYVQMAAFENRPAELAAAALSKLPQHVCQYYTQKEVNPRQLEKFEDERGVSVVRRKITGPEGRSTMAARRGSMLRKSMAPSASKGSSASKDSSSTAPASEFDAMAELHRSRKELEAHLARLPAFLRDTRNNALEAASSLGYDKNVIMRVLKDGVADDTMQIFMDNMVHCGYGKSPTFKDILVDVKHAVEAGHSAKPHFLDTSNWHQPPDAAGSLEGNHAVVSFRLPMDADADPPSPDEVYPRPPSSQNTKRHTLPNEDAVLPGAITDNAGSRPVTATRREERKQLPPGSEICTVCFEAPQEVEFVPCGHRVACEQCAQKLGSTCPLCRTHVTGHKKLFRLH